MAAWSFRSFPDLNLGPQIGANIKCNLPVENYYVHQDRGVGNDEDIYNLANDGPIARCMVEYKRKVFVERNLHSHLSSGYVERIDFYQDEQVELSTLAIKPATFVIFGKPGIGKTTIAKKMVAYLNAVYISPDSVCEYYRHHFIPEYIIPGKTLLGEKEKPKDSILYQLIQARLVELDVLHKGYVLEGIPEMEVDHESDMDLQVHLDYIMSFQPRPDFIILPFMQDVDLFKRRTEQKIDIETDQIYTRSQYINKKIEPMEPNEDRAYYYQQKKRKHSIDITTDAEFAGLTSMVHTQSRPDLTITTVKKNIDNNNELVASDDVDDEAVAAQSIPAEVIYRLLTRVDDSPYNIEKSFLKFRNWLPYLQVYVNTFDVRRVLELNAYWAPPIMMKMIVEFIDNFGITPAPIPVMLTNEIIKPKIEKFRGEAEEAGEYEDESPFSCEVSNEPEQPIDWPAMLRACAVRSRVDPRFRWRISRWKNLCPVALKHGRSLAGKPEFAVGFLDKVYFLSCKEAYLQFEFNPRPFLLPRMPTTPIKFFVVGHPLAGKTLFCERLAEHVGGIVVDMNEEFAKSFEIVKDDYLLRVRFQASLQAKINADHENYENWKRLERKRRADVMDWIEKFVRRQADSELNSLLKMAKEERDAKRAEMYRDIKDHQLGDTVAGQCTTDVGYLDFSWKQFVKELVEGRRKFTHQQRLELAWELFRQGKLRYKMRRRDLLKLLGKRNAGGASGNDWVRNDDDESELGEGVESFMGEFESEEGSDEEKANKKNKRGKMRRRRRCISVEHKDENKNEEEEEDAPYLQVIEEKESSVFDLEDETDESIKMRFPEIPAELIDAIPRPANVEDNDETVKSYVEEIVASAKVWADTTPPFLYVELLRRVIKETEAKYLENDTMGPLSGGWIIENLPSDVEKWRAILRTPDTAPDNVVALVDTDSNYKIIFNRLKALRLAEDRAKLEAFELAVLRAREREALGEGRELLGEGNSNVTSVFSIHPDERIEVMGEGTEFLGEKVDAPESQTQVPFPQGSDTEILDGKVDSKLDVLRAISTHEEEVLGEKEMLGEGKELEEIAGEGLTVKGQFLQKITRFNEFWNVVIPIMNEQQVKFWQMGVVNEDNVSGKINIMWEELESRFVLTPKKVAEGDLYDEDLDWKAAIEKWQKEEALDRARRENAERVKPPTATEKSNQEIYGEFALGEEANYYAGSQSSNEVSQAPKSQDLDLDIEEDEEEGEEDYEDDDELSGEEGSGDPFLTGKEKRHLARLIKKPEEYLKYLNEQKSMRLFGDVKDYCPVMLDSFGLLRKGSPKCAAKFHDNVYYFNDDSCFEKFNEDPMKFLPKTKPPLVPPPRICITGSPGCGQEEVGLEMSREYGIYYFNFRQRLHEAIRVKLGKNIGPDQISETLPGPQMSGMSLLGLEVSNSSFDVPNRILLGDSPTKEAYSPPKYREAIGEEEFEGEAGYYNEENFMPKQVGNAENTKPTSIFECPNDNIGFVEKPPSRDWNKIISSMEFQIKDFLENGDQLPEEVLNFFLTPLWHQEPFKSKGFIMVGFPNTEMDVNYMISRNLIPEFVHVLECKPKTMRNRLITRTVDDWHFKHPSRQAKDFLADTIQEEIKPNKARTKKKGRITASAIFESHAIEKHAKGDYLGEVEKKVMINKMTWSYNDTISGDISNALYKYHHIYSKDLHELKMSLNQNRVDWKPLHTDYSLEMSKSELRECLTNSLKYRNSLLESTYVLFQHEATTLLERGFFQLSKFGTWCPVQLSKGNTAINLWNGPGIKKTAVLHRQYIYYIAGEENVDHFRANVWNLIAQPIPTTNMPLFMVVTGPPKSGKTLLAQHLAFKLGLVYISEETMLDEIVKHSFLNKISEDFDLSSSKLTNGPQAMLMADEVLAYLRDGYTVPTYMLCRILDLALMAPRAQYHGVVFDHYPLESVQLQELLQRGIVPSVVVNLEMDVAETIDRCERHRFDITFNYDNLLEDGSALAQLMYEENQPIIEQILHWCRKETQTVFDVDATEHPTAIYEKIFSHASEAMKKIQQYIYNHQEGIPAILEGTTPLTSRLHTRLTREFGYYDSVALNENHELVAVTNYKDLRRVVEYRKELYVFSNLKNVQMFIKDPEKYSMPTCSYIPPEILPSACILTVKEMQQLREHWGFQDFDPIFYYEGNYQYKCLKRGESKYCAEYNGKLYFFINQENLDKFLKKPFKYCDVPTPARFPIRPVEDPIESVSPPGYVIATGLSQELVHMLSLLASKRPRFPFMSTTKSALLYIGYYLKTLNMKTPFELRSHYRKAMTHITNTQSAVEKLCTDLNELHGKRSIPPEIKRKLKILMELADKPDDEKVVDPKIHWLPFSYEAATISKESTTPPNDVQVLKEFLEDVEESLEQQENEGEDLEKEDLNVLKPKMVTAKSLFEDYVPPPYLSKNKLY